MVYSPAMDTKTLTPYQRMQVENKQRRAKALALRDANKTMEEIGTELGVTHQRASQLVDQAMREAGRK